MSITFDASGLEELSKALEQAEKRFPYTVEKVLKKEAKNIAKDLKNRVDEEAKGHHWKPKNSSEEEEAEPLAESFRPGKVIRSRSKYTTAVTSGAPHYHLYEEGHLMVTHNKKKRGKSKSGTGKVVGEVAGRKTVARYQAQRSEYSEIIGQEILDEILKEAGFDT